MSGIVVLVVGVVLLAVGGGLLWWGRKTQAKTDLMRSVATASAADVPRLLPGELTEVKGTIRCDSPLTSPEARTPCVWYRSEVKQEYEEREKDSDGNWRTSRGSETVSSNEESAPFFVEDATGRVRIDPANAEIDAPTLVDRFEQQPSGVPAGLSVNVGGLTIGGGRRTLGYRHTERLLAVGTPVYILGAVRESGEIGALPEGAHGHFIISHRSEETLTRSWGRTARRLGYAAAACLALGAVAAAVGLVLLVL
ncbi:MAG TPA: E3 ubiquitin ligase family protein [Thermomicrobiaceae bacterium]|nr:E3 ubiquitin ligase family protein [Thermomicrobiaceae bacterium]